MQEKTPLVAQICVLSDYNNENNEAFEYLSVKFFFVSVTSFSKTTLLQREPFFTMIDTINSLPLLVTK